MVGGWAPCPRPFSPQTLQLHFARVRVGLPSALYCGSFFQSYVKLGKESFKPMHELEGAGETLLFRGCRCRTVPILSSGDIQSNYMTSTSPVASPVHRLGSEMLI